MNRLTTDNPQNNIETMMNMVHGKDGWQYIRYGDAEMLTTDFCLMICERRECMLPSEVPTTNEAKDEMLCDCASDGCYSAILYTALCGFGHVRDRLKMYEDAGIAPPGHTLDNKTLGEV